MRAICEVCARAQPVDWEPGHLCVGCGAAVRREARCFWCTQWTPFGRFCRGCGAEVVEGRLYGAARMIKDAGTDRFTVPKMLRELDPEQVENFSRIYQRHAVTADSHVEDLRALEGFLHHRSFSEALADELIPQLPWPKQTLIAMTMEPRRADMHGGLALATEIAGRSPFAQTRMLAAVVRARFGDEAAISESLAAMRSASSAIRDEAALALSSWRVVTVHGAMSRDGTVADHLRRSPCPLEAAVGLALLGAGDADAELIRDGLSSVDPDIAFGAALALGDVRRLTEALRGEDLQRRAAAVRLVELGILAPLEPLLREGSLELRLAIAHALARREEGAGPLAKALLEIAVGTPDDRLRELAARCLCRAMDPRFAMPIARAGKEDQYIVQSLLSERAALPAQTVAEVCAFLAAEGRLRSEQYGVPEAARRGAIPDGLVPSCFARAADQARIELLRIAHVQLEARGSEGLHRFLIGVVFGPYSGPIRAKAWWALWLWYRREDHGSFGPFALNDRAISRFFPSPGVFVAGFLSVLADRESLREVGLYEFLAHFLKTAEPACVLTLAATPEAEARLIETLTAVIDGDYWLYLRTAAAGFLGHLGAAPSLKTRVCGCLDALRKRHDGDLRRECERALERLGLAAG